jgi:hypothetical protein
MLTDSLAVNAPDEEQTNLVGALRETVRLSIRCMMVLIARSYIPSRAPGTRLHHLYRLR